MTQIATIIGLIAGALTTAAALPQIHKALVTKKTHDISLTMYIFLCVGVGLWLVYGLLIQELPVILWNGVSVCLLLVVLGLKIRYG